MQRKDKGLPSAKYAANQGMSQETVVRYSQRTFGSSLLSMRLHGDVGIEMVQSAVGLFATVPATLVHALDLLISSSRTLVLLRPGDGHERVNLLKNQVCVSQCAPEFYNMSKSTFFLILLESADELWFFFFSFFSRLFLLLSRLQTRVRATPLGRRAKITAAPPRLSTMGADNSFCHIRFVH